MLYGVSAFVVVVMKKDRIGGEGEGLIYYWVFRKVSAFFSFISAHGLNRFVMSGASLTTELEASEKLDEANEDYPGTEVSLEGMVSSRGIWGRLEESIMSCMHGEVVDRPSLCVILDLNGLLLFRETRKDRVVGNPPPADFRMKTGRAWLRPNSSMFLLYAFRRFRVGFWSSAMSHNVLLMLRSVLHPFQKPIFVLNREDTLPDPAPDAKPYATLKDLTMVRISIAKEIRR